MKKKFVIALAIGTILLIGLETMMYFINQPKYTLHLPTMEKLESITIENKKIENKEEIKEILDLLNKEGRTTKEASIQDNPVNASEQFKINFHFLESGTSMLFVYRKNNSYYIEQPYNGIYKITKSEYNEIKSMLYK